MRSNLNNAIRFKYHQLAQGVRFGYHQARNLVKLDLGQRLTSPTLVANTLDQDDVKIAKSELKNRDHWFRADDVTVYEKTFADWNQSSYVFAFMEARVALSASIYALNLKPGDEVIIPGYTCVVVLNSFRFAGIKAVFGDIELDTYGLAAECVENLVTPKTKAILLHHLYGLVCRDYEQLLSIAQKHHLSVIEDCAMSTGAVFKDRKIGNYGDIAIYSSEQTKVFTTIQGGLAVTNRKDLADRLKGFYSQAAYPQEGYIDKLLHTVFINYFSFKHPHRWWREELVQILHEGKTLRSTTREEEQGVKPAHYGCRMPAPVARIGINQLRKIDAYNQTRRETSQNWDTWCRRNGYQQPFVVPDSTPVFLRYPVLVEPENKRDTRWAHVSPGVTPGVWFVSNIHPVAGELKSCPRANTAVRRCINFPTLLF